MTEPHPTNCGTITRERLVELLKMFDRNVIDAPNATICPYCGDIYYLGKAICGKSIYSSANTSDKVLEDIVGIMERYPTDTYYKDCLRELREKIAEGA
jgi:hypothetical protein